MIFLKIEIKKKRIASNRNLKLEIKRIYKKKKESGDHCTLIRIKYI